LGRELESEVDAEHPYLITSEEAATLDELIDLPPERLDVLSFEGERPAVCHLEERSLTQTFVELAQLLDAEAHADRQAQERAELSVVASELFAMLGDKERAQAVLSHAPRVGIALQTTQQRQLAFDPEDRSTYGKHIRSELRAEVRGGVSHEARRHLMALQVDLGHELNLDEPERRRHLELSLRAFPTDPRFQFQRLVSQLDDPSQPSVRLRQSMNQDALGRPEVIRDLVHLRAHTSPRGEANHPLFAILDARRALREGPPTAVVEALETLTGFETALQRAATWLVVSLASQAPSHHQRVGKLLEQLAEPGAPDAELAWLEHRLAKPEDRPASLEIFSLGVLGQLPIEDKLALAVAAQADRETIQLFVETVARQGTHPGFLPFVEATRQAILRDYASTTIDPRASAEMLLGLGLGSVRDSSSETAPDREPGGGLPLDALLAVSQLENVDASQSLPVALRLWHACHGTALTSTAGCLQSLAAHWQTQHAGAMRLLAAVMMDLDGNRGEATHLLRECLDSDSPLEATLRAAEAIAPGTGASVVDAFDALVRAMPASLRRSILALEVAHRRERQDGVPPSGVVTSAVRGEQDSWLAEDEPLLSALLAFSLPAERRHWSQLVESTNAQDERLATQLLLDFRSECPGEVAPTYLDVPAALAYLDGLPRRVAANDEDVERWTQLRVQWSSLLAERHEEFLVECRRGDGERFDVAMSLAKNADDPEEFLHFVAQAAALDPEREPGVGSVRAAELLIQRVPKHVGALRTLLVRAATDGKSAELSSLAERLAPLLPRPERNAHAWLSLSAHRQAVQSGTRSSADAVPLEDLLGRSVEPESWFLRRLLAAAELTRNDPVVFDCLETLRAMASSPFDAATLGLRGAETALRLERWDEGEALLDDAVQLAPTHLVALSTRAELLDARGLTSRAAEAYEALADASCMPMHRVAAWLHAAELFETVYRDFDASPSEDRENDAASDATGTELRDAVRERAIGCLERAVHLDGTQTGAFEKLRKYYLELERFVPLEGLLTEQLLLVEAPKRRAELEIERARLQLELSRTDEARRGLERALALQPDHADALVLLSQILVAQGDGDEAEQHLVRLAASANDSLALEAYRQLASLYDTILERPARAEVAYREILRRNPGDPAGDHLVAILLRLDQPADAVAVLLELLEHSKDTVFEKSRNLELARIYDAILGERRRAEEVFERTRRKWPHDPQVLRALAAFHERARDPAAVGALLDRSLAEARRALGSGRFDTSFFEIIATVGELRNTPDLEVVSSATLAAISANPTSLEGVGPRAAEDAFADLLAPDGLNLPLRALLRRTGRILSAVTRVDLKSMRASPLNEQSRTLATHLSTLARHFGIGDLESYISPALGTVCQPLGQDPPALVVGPGFLNLEPRSVQDALAIRAMRILSANATALSNTSPVDLWPLLAAYLSVHIPDYVPQGVDAKRLAQLRAPMAKALPSGLDSDLPMLAADVVATIGNRASQLGALVQQWGARTALLALGDPWCVLMAVAAAAGQQDRFSGSADERLKWLIRNPEARDLAVFSVTETYLEARARGRT
jgi:tetratricopeptide (TPR) repeat protein